MIFIDNNESNVNIKLGYFVSQYKQDGKNREWERTLSLKELEC